MQYQATHTHTHMKSEWDRGGLRTTGLLTSKYNVEEGDRRNKELGAHSNHVLVNQRGSKNSRKGCYFAVVSVVNHLKGQEEVTSIAMTSIW